MQVITYTSDVTKKLRELLDLLGGYSSLIGPSHHNSVIYTIDCMCEFEPWGRASENWDMVWRMTFHTEQARYHHMKDGLLPCNGDWAPQRIEAPSLEQVIEKSIQHFTQLRKQQKEEQNGKSEIK